MKIPTYLLYLIITTSYQGAWGSRFRTASRYDSSRSWPEMQSKTSKDYLGAVGTIERLLIGRYRPNFVRNKTVQNFQLIVVLGTFDT